MSFRSFWVSESAARVSDSLISQDRFSFAFPFAHWCTLRTRLRQSSSLYALAVAHGDYSTVTADMGPGSVARDALQDANPFFH